MAVIIPVSFQFSNSGNASVQAGINQLGQQVVTGVNTATQHVGRSFDMLQRAQAVAYGYLISQVTGLMLDVAKAVVVGPIKAAADLEVAMAKLGTLFPELTKGGEQFRQALLDMDKGLGSTAELAEGLYQVLQVGVHDPKEAMLILESAAKLAALGLVDMKTAAIGLTTTMQAYNIEGERAGEVAKILFAGYSVASTAFGTFVSRIGTVIPFARLLNIDLQELVSLFSFLTRAGVPAALAFTNIKNTINKLAMGTDEAYAAIGKLFASFGPVNQGNIAQLVEKTGGLNKFLTELVKRSDEAGVSMKEFFPDLRAVITPLAIAADNGKKLAESIALVAQNVDNLDLDKGVKQLNDTFYAQAKIAGSNVWDIMAQGAARYTDGLKGVLKHLNAVIGDPKYKEMLSGMAQAGPSIFGFLGSGLGVPSAIKDLYKGIQAGFEPPPKPQISTGMDWSAWAAGANIGGPTEAPESAGKQAAQLSEEAAKANQKLIETYGDAGLAGAVTELRLRYNGLIVANFSASEATLALAKDAKQLVDEFAMVGKTAPRDVLAIADSAKKVSEATVDAFVDQVAARELYMKVEAERLEVSRKVWSGIDAAFAEHSKHFDANMDKQIRAIVENIGGVKDLEKSYKAAGITGFDMGKLMTEALTSTGNKAAALQARILKLNGALAVIADWKRSIDPFAEIEERFGAIHDAMVTINEETPDSFKDWQFAALDAAQVMDGLAQTMGRFSQMTGMSSGAAKTFKTLQDMFEGFSGSMQLFASGNKLGGAMVGIGTIGQVLGQTSSRAAQVIGGAMQGAMSGAAMGAMWGSKAGVYGAIAGAVVGGIAAAIGSAKDPWKKVADSVSDNLHVNISQGTAEALQKLSTGVGGGSWTAKMTIKGVAGGRDLREVLGLDLIIKDIGVTQQNLEMFATEAVSQLSLIAQGGKLGEEAFKHFDSTFGQLSNAAEQLGKRGSTAMLLLVKSARDAGVMTESMTQDFAKLATEYIPQLDALFGSLGKGAKLTAEEFSVLGEAVAESFNAMLAAGMSVSEILDKMGPSLDGLAKYGSMPGLDLIFGLKELSDAAPDAVGKLDALGASMRFLSQIGVVSADVFRNWQTALIQNSVALTKAGASQQELLILMQPQLAMARQLAEVYSYELDPAIAAMIKRGEEMGMSFEVGKPVMEDIRDILLEVAAALGSVAAQARLAGKAIVDIPPPPAGGVPATPGAGGGTPQGGGGGGTPKEGDPKFPDQQNMPLNNTTIVVNVDGQKWAEENLYQGTRSGRYRVHHNGIEA